MREEEDYLSLQCHHQNDSCIKKGSDAESHILLQKLKCCFTSTETVGLLGTAAQDVQLDFDTAPDL